MPSFVTISRGGHNEMAWLDEIPLEAGSYYVMDRGYLDLRRLQRFTREAAANMRLFISGSAPLSADVHRAFHATAVIPPPLPAAPGA